MRPNAIATSLILCVCASVSASLSSAPKPRIETFAGTGQAGYAGDGGLATKAQLNNPFGVARGPDGALYICDTMNHVIRKVDRNGVITTVAGAGRKGYSGDSGPALDATLNEPYEVRFDKQGDMFFVERLNHTVRRVDAKTWIITTVAGSGKAGFSGDGGAATQATMNQPHSIQFDARGDLYICDILNHRIRKVDMKTGVITTFAGTGEKKPTPDDAKIAGTPLNGPRTIDFDRRGDMWLALREGNAVYRLDMKAGTIHHIAGTGEKGFTGNGGPAKLATLSGPKGLSVAPNGNIYLADTESHSIRMIDVRKKTMELVAGTGARGDGSKDGEDGDPLARTMARPHGVFVDRDGSIFIGDSETHRVRVIRVGAASGSERYRWRIQRTVRYRER
jgi:streptogramin lyase